MRIHLMDWYHEALLHPRQARMIDTVLRQFTWLGCTANIACFTQTCRVCQTCKSTNKGKYSKIPQRDNLRLKPWEVFSVDLVGPWKVAVKHLDTDKTTFTEIWALTMMADASGWIKIIPIGNKRSWEIAFLTDSKWFC